MSNQIDAAIAEAEAAAASVNAVAVPEQGGQQVATAQNAPVDMSLGSFLKAGGIQPDKWAQVDKYGIKLDKNEKAFVEEFTGTIDFSNVKLFVGLRIKLPGNKYEYIKSYDGRTEAKSGQNWNAAVVEANARAIEPATTYRGADVLVTLTQPLTQGKSTFEVGTKVGYTTSITGFGAFQSFLNELVGNGDVTVGANETLSGSVETVVAHEAKKNADFEWGILTFSKA